MRIRKSRLLMTFENLCAELERRSLREIDVCAFHTRLLGQTAYALSISKQGLFSILTQAESPKHVKLFHLQILGGEERSQAKVHVVHEDDVATMAFITSRFFYEGMRGEELKDLFAAFPGIDDYRHVTQTHTAEIDLVGFQT